MNKVVIVPDSFKGTMSAQTVCRVIASRVARCFPKCEIVSVPIADGGEGTVDCFLHALGGQTVTARVSGPFGKPMDAAYGILRDGRTAVIEMAACAGLPLVEGRADPLRATTYGVGELLLHAVSRGCRRLILGLGGSCTNDAGAGAAAACGIRFYDASGAAFVPTGGTLSRIARIDASARAPLPDGVSITVMCDVDNPLYGAQGAAYVFAPQKGADKAAVALLDEGLRHIAAVIARDCGRELSSLPGGGAAGGMGVGMTAFFNAPLKKGIDTVLDEVAFDTIAADADWIITGEGRFDSQSLGGKAVMGVARRAKALGVPTLVLTGAIGDGIDEAYQQGVRAVFSINRAAEDLSHSRFHAEENLALTVDNVLYLLGGAPAP